MIFFMATGTEPLELEGKFLSIDWRNHPRSQEFVVVDEKVLVSWNNGYFFIFGHKNLPVPLP